MFLGCILQLRRKACSECPLGIGLQVLDSKVLWSEVLGFTLVAGQKNQQQQQEKSGPTSCIVCFMKSALT